MRYVYWERGRMRYLAFILWAATCVSAQAAHTLARLVLEADAARPGETVLAGVHLRMDKGWHKYWRNSGGSSIPTTIDWKLPKGVTAGAIQWPTPQKLPDKELTTYIYENDVVLLAPLTIAPDAPSGEAKLEATVTWLECQVQCIKGDATVTGSLEIGTPSKPSKEAEFIASWKKKLPRNGDGLGAKAFWEAGAKDDLRPLILEWNAASAVGDADFYPDSNEKFEVQPITERLPDVAGKIRLRAQVKKFEGDWPKEVSGLLIQKTGTEIQAFDAKLSVDSAGPAASASASPQGTTGGVEIGRAS